MKIGKTTFATQIPHSLLLAFEKGYQALPSVYAQDIVTWADFQRAVLQLGREEVKDKFKTIVFDTADVAWDLCTQYVCSKHGVAKLSDVAWGRAYKEASDEFYKQLRIISMAGYGIVFISHATVLNEAITGGDDASDEEVQTREVVQCSLNKRPYKIINGLVDLIGYIGTEYNEENGSGERYIYTRETPGIVAGNRFPYLPAKIPFSYESLVEELGNAIQLSAQKAGVKPTDEEVLNIQMKDEYSFEELNDIAKDIWEQAISQDPANSIKIMDMVEKVFGVRLKLSSITPSQRELYEVLVQDLRTEFADILK